MEKELSMLLGQMHSKMDDRLVVSRPCPENPNKLAPFDEVLQEWMYYVDSDDVEVAWSRLADFTTAEITRSYL